MLSLITALLIHFADFLTSASLSVFTFFLRTLNSFVLYLFGSRPPQQAQTSERATALTSDSKQAQVDSLASLPPPRLTPRNKHPPPSRSLPQQVSIISNSLRCVSPPRSLARVQ